MTTQGAMFAADAPIRQTLRNLAEYFAAQQKSDPDVVAQKIDAAMRANTAIFFREERDDDVVYITSKQGTFRPREADTVHMFKRRLYEPENPLPVDDINVVVTTNRPALTTVEPVFISEYWQRQAGLLPIEDGDGLGDDGFADTLVAEAAPEEAPAEVEGAPAPEPAEAAPVVDLPVAPSTVVMLPNGVQVDFNRSVDDLMAQHGQTLVTQLRNAIENDPLRRLVLFGNDVFAETAIASFGKNDMRRIRDYLLEVGEPLLDTQIIDDIFYHNARQADYESFRFALNYRLYREKEFEFVGVEGARLWSSRGLPAIGSKRIKASEMGQIAGYIEEGFDDSLQNQSAEAIRQSGTLTHVLSFFEWQYGVLPFTRALATLLPPALLPDQRTAVLRFESPQHYTTMLTELRYPTGNRGGWLSGFEEFFREHLVPGALITLSRTATPHVFTLTYEEQPEVEERLLVIDEKKNKLAFADVVFFCMVDPDMLPTQRQFGRLRNLKALPMNDRRKGEQVLEHVFATVGEPVGTRNEPRYYAAQSDLYVAMNVLRPTSQSLLEHLLRTGEYYSADESTPGAWYFAPPPSLSDAAADAADESEYDDEYDDE